MSPTVRDLPPGRQPVVTSRVPGPKARQKTWHFIREKLAEGRQCYVICPKVGTADEARLSSDGGESDELSASVEATYKELTEGELKEVAVGLVHGKMDADKKESAMTAFKTGETRVLVSTTVVEVGVDVPNATLMVIQKAESFGLSQLHQLRGRVARGSRRGYCFLYTDQTTPRGGGAAGRAGADDRRVRDRRGGFFAARPRPRARHPPERQKRVAGGGPGAGPGVTGRSPPAGLPFSRDRGVRFAGSGRW